MKRGPGMKLLIVSADPRMSLGYSKVINKISNYLATKDDLEVVMFTLNYNEDRAIKNTYVDPHIKLIPVKDPTTFAYDKIQSVVDKENPDYVLVYSCVNVLYNYVTQLDKKTKIISYIDICQKWSDTLKFQELKSRVHHWFTFLDCWRDHLISDQKIDASKVSVLEHAINFEEFEDLPVHQCKQYFGFDGFTVTNMNRNSLRKGWNITLAGFIEFLSRHDYDPSIKLYISCGTDNDPDKHCNIEEYVYTEFMKRGLNYLDYTRNFIINTKPLLLSKQELNMIYCATDVGMNTCLSEGFGLSSVEHAYFNKPQILTDIATFRDTLGDFPVYVKPSVTTTYIGSNELTGERAILNYMDVADALDKCYKERPIVNTREYVLNRYSREKIHKQIDRMYDILKDGSL